MDERLRILDDRRAVPSGVTPDMPLVTVGWRALNDEHERRARERQSAEAQERRLREMVVRIGDQAHALHCLSRESGITGESVSASARQIQEALAGIGVHLVTSEGEVYSSDLMDVLENIAQRPDPDATVPRIAEVMLPAILWRGEVLQMGKVVVGLPVPPSKTDANG